MPETIDIAQCLKVDHPIIDVRTPAEFAHGHIPGAHNIPLFSDGERVIVGTIYKKEGKDAAIHRGLEFVGPKMSAIVKEAIALNPEKKFRMHCWRGGMRSASVAWLLETFGCKVYLLKGGYKSFRHFALEMMDEPYNLVILGGRTGSGKTLVLQELQHRNEQVIDLEGMANHKGSSFGALGEDAQPSQEHFENDLAMQLFQLDKQKITWVEDESRLVGKKVLPPGIWQQMRNSRVIYMDIPFRERAVYLTEEYGKFPVEELKAAFDRIKKRLGGQHHKAAMEALDAGDLYKACEISLVYYDKAYDYGISRREKDTVHRLEFEKLDIHYIADKIVAYSKQL